MTDTEIVEAFQAVMRSNEARAAETAELDQRLRTLEKRLYLLAEKMQTPRERSPIEVALQRSLLHAVAVGIAAFGTTYQTTGNLGGALAAAIAAAGTVIVTRGAGEGAVDESRANRAP